MIHKAEQPTIGSVLSEMDGELAVLDHRREKTRADWAIVIVMIGGVTVAGIAISLFVTLTIIRLLAWLFGG